MAFASAVCICIAITGMINAANASITVIYLLSNLTRSRTIMKSAKGILYDNYNVNDKEQDDYYFDSCPAD